MERGILPHTDGVAHPLVLVTGFGAFEEVAANPSEEIARRLAASGGPEGAVGPVFRAAVLPVSFERVPAALDRFVAENADARPALLLAMGVQKEAGFLLESVARARLTEACRPDVDGVSAADATPYEGPDRVSPLDLGRIARAVRARSGAEVGVSDDAGGYVCERTFYRVLEHAESLGIPGLFVHVPPLEVGAEGAIERGALVCRLIAEEALR